MNSFKCTSCSLVDRADEPNCRRCGASFYAQASSSLSGSSKSPKPGGMSIPIMPIAVVALIAFGLYTYFGTAASTGTPPPSYSSSNSSAQPKPTLSLRDEHQQKQTGAYIQALKDNPSFKASDQRLAEAQKLMQPNSGQPQK